MCGPLSIGYEWIFVSHAIRGHTSCSHESEAIHSKSTDISRKYGKNSSILSTRRSWFLRHVLHDIEFLTEHGFIWDPQGLTCEAAPASALMSKFFQRRSRARDKFLKTKSFPRPNSTSKQAAGANERFFWRWLKLQFEKIWIKTKAGKKWRKFVRKYLS